MKRTIRFEVMMMVLAVLAGTPVDTAMGIAFIESRGHKAYGFPVSRTPEEQSILQVVHPEALAIKVEVLLDTIHKQGIRDVYVYCNSIAAAVDLETLAKKYPLRLVSPLTVYRTLSLEHRRLGVLAANNQSTYGIERAIQRENPSTQVFGLGVLSLVEAVEQGLPPQRILENFHLKELLVFFEGLRCEALILGCTHFSYFHQALGAMTTLPILDPADGMLKILIEEEATEHIEGVSHPSMRLP